jgi:hypothetical protein
MFGKISMEATKQKYGDLMELWATSPRQNHMWKHSHQPYLDGGYVCGCPEGCARNAFLGFEKFLQI